MNPQPLFCLNLDCSSRGKIDAGNIGPHSTLEGRFRCHTCGTTFVSTKGTIFYRLRTDPKIVVLVLALLAYGCPPQAIVRAFALDARTVDKWQERAGEHCEAMHRDRVENQPRDLGQVQADEIRAKLQKGIFWMAMGIQVRTRLWLGGFVSAHRDGKLIWRLAQCIRSQALQRPILLVTDGLSAYVNAWKRAFCTVLRAGQKGRPPHIPWPKVVIGQVVKRYVQNRVVGVEQRLIQGTKRLFKTLSVTGQKMNTAYIERLNATFRQRFCGLVRRGRCLLRQEGTLRSRMYLVGCVYNFCTPHQSLRVPQPKGSPRVECTPGYPLGDGGGNHRGDLERERSVLLSHRSCALCCAQTNVQSGQATGL
jgi:transposase-like protein